MFLYVKNYFQKRKSHIFLIIFCGLLMFNSIINLIDLKNYKILIDYYAFEPYSISGTKATFYKPMVFVKHKHEETNPIFDLVVGQMLDTHISKIAYTVEYKVYHGTELIDSYVWNNEIENGEFHSAHREKYYEDEISDIDLSVINYDIKFDAQVYLWHIFVIIGSLFFIVPSAVMLFKRKKEENGSI